MKVLSPLTGPGADRSAQADSPVHVQAFVGALADLGYQVTVISRATASEQTFNGDFGRLVRLVRHEAWNRAARSPRRGRIV